MPARARLAWAWIAVLSAIGVAVVVRRMLLLLGTAPGVAALDKDFARYRLLTLVHITPGLLFVMLGPLQFVRTLRTRWPALHRWIGRIVLASGLIVGVTALVMSPQLAIGGVNETAATMLFAILFLVALCRAFVAIRQRRVGVHREWMIRAFAIGLAVALIRPIVGIFFATSRLTHLTPREFFGTAFWLGFTLQSIAAEVWINYDRTRRACEKPVLP